MGHPVDVVHCAPTLIENMYEYIQDHGGDFAPLTSLKMLQPGGAALSDNLVKVLTSNGVNLTTTYGTTEIGPPLRTIPHTRDNPKCYTFRNLYPDNKFLKMEEVGEGLYECIIYKGFEFAAELWEGKPDDEPYRTNDLFIQDPPGSGFFVLQGRKDDILGKSCQKASGIWLI
jgi:acyl-coenzyme A synthetase/AMP-(fatty) acid ligase